MVMVAVEEFVVTQVYLVDTVVPKEVVEDVYNQTLYSVKTG